MGYVPDHLHPRPFLACPYGHHPRYLGIVVRSPPKGSTYANRILPRYAYVTQSLFILLYVLFCPKGNEQDTDYPSDRSMEDSSQTSQCVRIKKNPYTRLNFIINVQYKKGTEITMFGA